jgi:tetratricopeptide (TPR) repeat protein
MGRGTLAEDTTFFWNYKTKSMANTLLGPERERERADCLRPFGAWATILWPPPLESDLRSHSCEREVDLSLLTRLFGVDVMPLRPLVCVLLLALGGLSSPDLARGDDERDRKSMSKDQVAFGIEVARLGLWREAIYRWEKAVELDPENPSARNNLAVAYEQAGDFEQANETYERALELAPNNLYIRQNYELFREAYERRKRTEERSNRD